MLADLRAGLHLVRVSASDPIARLNEALEGRYRIERELGRGGMGSVYLATDRGGRRRVAIKVLTPELTESVGAAAFSAEIKTLENLRHPHILPVLESGAAGPLLFYVMPYVEGQTLRERILSGKSPGLHETVQVVTAVAEALQYAHDRGVTHLDIKPANIMMPEGQPVVVDFGVSLAVGVARGGGLGNGASRVGHPDYRAPELQDGLKGVGPQSDVYALAGVLYEALTGERPNRDGTHHLDLIQSTPASESEAGKTLPTNVAAAMRKALQGHPAARFQSARDFARALATVPMGEFPFPLKRGAKESPYLTWIRNRSNYMGVGGLLDYARAVGVLIRGLAVNLVFVALPYLLGIAVIVAWRRMLAPSLGHYFLTLCAAVVAAVWILLFPLLTPLYRVLTYERSLESGSESSVQSRDRYERSFGWILILVAGAALLESVAYLGDALIRPDFPVGPLVLLIVVALLGSYQLLSWLGGAAEKMASVTIGLLGLFVPLLIVVYVAHFIGGAGEPEARLAAFLNAQFGFQLRATDVADYWIWGAYAMLVASPGVSYLVTVPLWLSTSRRLLVMWACKVFRRPVPESYSRAWRSFKDMFKLTWRFMFAFLGVSLLAGIAVSLYPSDLAARFVFVLSAAVSLWVFAWITIDINLSSVHGLYRDRLASAFLVGEDAEGDVGVERDLDLAELSRHEAGSTAPYHLINAALNLQGSKDVSVRDRQADFFIFSKKFIGGERTGYCRGEAMERVFPEMGLSTAMAISAAAASPNMGRSTSPAYAVIMALLNIRLGFWLPNPGRVEEVLVPKRHRVKRAAGRVPGCRFEQVFMEELVEVRRRWSQLPQGKGRSLHPSNEACSEETAVAHGLFGLALSGGGIRSATLNLGIVQALHARGVFDHVDYMSTVSGGGYLGSSLSALMRHRTRTTSEVRGKVRVRLEEDGRPILAVDPEAPWFRRIFEAKRRPPVPREYKYAEFAELAVKDGDLVRAGQKLLSTRGDQELIRSGSFGDRFSWRVPPGAFIREMLGRLNEHWRWVNVSDGGHLENLATMELLRRRCRYIIIGDGEADPEHAFNGLATLIRLARIDLGIHIDIDLDGLRLATRGSKKGLSSRHWAVGEIRYPGEALPGQLLYLKSSLTGDEDEVIREYRHKSPLFPHESTADQFFTEGQFEAYRSLGQHIGEEVLEALACEGPGMPYEHIGTWFTELEKRAKA